MNLERFYGIEAVIAAILFLLALFVYGGTSWHRTTPGRILFSILFNFATVLTLVAVVLWNGFSEIERWVLFIVFSLTALNGLVILMSIITGQLIGARKNVRDSGRND